MRMNKENGMLSRLAFLVSLCVFVFSLLLGGCSLRSVKPTSVELNSEQDLVIAQDFANVLVQINALSPWAAVLSFGLDNEQEATVGLSREQQLLHRSFARAFRAAVTQSGYATRTVQDSNVSHFVSFSVTSVTDVGSLQTFTYDVSVGEVDFRRAYRSLEDGGIAPVSTMLVRGADISHIVSNDSIFEPRYNNSDTHSIARENTRLDTGFDSPLQEKRQPAQLIPPINKEVVEPLLNAQDTQNAEPAIAVDDTQFSLVRKANIADTGSSNYESLLLDKQDIAEQTLIFGDDSYVLGNQNKNLLSKVMSDFNPETDVVSVVGCSTGTTKIENGNAALAIGRANRVKEALLYNGIPHDKIYDEGCWSPNANSTSFPNRGVVITIKRLVEPG